jgi:hypothetical protein
MMTIYIYIHTTLVHCIFSKSIRNPRTGHYGVPDWELKGALYQCFWLRFLVWTCMCDDCSFHYDSESLALSRCVVPRCKLLLQEPPDLALHENVLQFPQEKMADLLRATVLFAYATKHTMCRTSTALFCFGGTMFEMLGIAKVDPTQCGFPISRSRQYLLLALSSSGIKLLIIDVRCCWVVVCAERYVCIK